MYKNKSTYILLTISLFVVQAINAQISNQGRLYYFGQTTLNNQSKLSIASGWHTQPKDLWNRLEFRTTYFHRMNHWFRIGLGQRSNFAIQEGSLLHYELRPFQSLLFDHNLSTNTLLTHRFMFEQRIFFNPNIDNEFNTRLRYRIELKQSLPTPNRLYLRPMSEFFYGKNDVTKELLQWKNTLAIGHTLSPTMIIEYRYEYVIVKNNNSPNHFNGFRIQLIQYF
ncbi:DUF2490 domain-containing protein [Saccharicrinis aurantiacus]|uniref:DUF2490 domain-containing protein n=1 Tax=Saccharicrinis aurantiacus TaxID=1849719 RepID=UPI00248FF997|nr:DUF2490 domain-containing protein [Saccharicrinis aurantiacus]